VIALIVAVALAATPAPLAQPTLPPIAAARALPYPASGNAQPGVVSTHRDPTVPVDVTLDQAIAIGLARSPSLREAGYTLDYQRAEIDTQRSATRPDISIGPSSARNYEQETAQQLTPGWTTSNSVALTLSQLIYDGGQTRARIRSAQASASSSAASARRTAQQVAYDVATAYYNVLAAERTLAADMEVLREDLVNEELVRAQIAAGTAAGADLSLQLYTTAQARTALVREQGTEQAARVTFATSMGLDADTLVLPIDDTAALAGKNAAPIVLPYADALATAIAHRPDLQGSDLDVVAARESLVAAQRGLSPSLSASLSKGLSSFDAAGGSYRNNASIGFNVTIPIYDRGATHASIAEARATADRLSVVARGTAISVQQDVRNALIGIVSAQSTLDQARAEYASAAQTLAQTQGQYRAGVTTLPSLVQAQTAFTQASTDIVTAMYALRQAEVTQRLALGTDL
jgi:outer membrane protein TolC